jgi:hypothetical protein
MTDNAASKPLESANQSQSAGRLQTACNQRRPRKPTAPKHRTASSTSLHRFREFVVRSRSAGGQTAFPHLDQDSDVQQLIGGVVSTKSPARVEGIIRFAERASGAPRAFPSTHEQAERRLSLN